MSGRRLFEKIIEIPAQVTEEEATKILWSSPSRDIDLDVVKTLFNRYFQPHPTIFTEIKKHHGTVTIPNSEGEKKILHCIQWSSMVLKEKCEKPMKITGSGAAFDKQTATRIAAYKFIENVAENAIDVIMPHALIGLPNYRGHCFMLPTIVPLLCNKEFVKALLEGAKIAEGQQKICTIFFAFYSIYLEYKKASREGALLIKKVPKAIEQKYGEAPTDTSSTSGRKDAAYLDRSGIKLLIELRDRYDKNLNTPGYDSTLFYRILMTGLAEDFEKIDAPFPFKQINHLNYSFTYSCSHCGTENLYINHTTSALKIVYRSDTVNEIQDYFLYPKSLIELNNKCLSKINESKCGRIISKIEDFQILDLPKILVFYSVGDRTHPLEDPKESYLNIKMNDSLVINGPNGNIIYLKYAFSVGHYIYRMPNGKLRSLRHVPRKPGDHIESGHVFLVIRSGEQWFEVNNNKVFLPLQEYPIVRGRQLIFYCQEGYEPKTPEVQFQFQ